jgi:hypothetical protein
VQRYEDKRRFSSSQARDWLEKASAPGKPGALAAARAALSPEEWAQVSSFAAGHLSAGPRDFPAAFDLVVAEP